MRKYILCVAWLSVTMLSSQTVRTLNFSTTGDATAVNLGTELADEQLYASDVTDLDVIVFNASSAVAAAAGTSSGSLVLFKGSTISTNIDYICQISPETGIEDDCDYNYPLYLVITTPSKEPFAFKGVTVGDFIGAERSIIAEAFLQGTSLGSVTLLMGDLYEKTFGTETFDQSVFGNVDEVRFSRGDTNFTGHLAGFNDFCFKALNTRLFAEGATNTWMTLCADEVCVLPEGCTAYALSSVSGGTVTLEEVPMVNISDDPNFGKRVVPAYAPVLIKRAEGTVTAPIKAAFGGVEAFNYPNAWDLSAEDLKTCTDPDNNGNVFNKNYGFSTQSGYCWSDDDSGNKFWGNLGTVSASITDIINSDADYAYFFIYGDRFIRIEGNPGLKLHRCVLAVKKENLVDAGGAGVRELMIRIEGEDATGVSEVLGEPSDQGGANGNSWFTLDGRQMGGEPSRAGVYIYKGEKVVMKK